VFRDCVVLNPFKNQTMLQFLVHISQLLVMSTQLNAASQSFDMNWNEDFVIVIFHVIACEY